MGSIFSCDDDPDDPAWSGSRARAGDFLEERSRKRDILNECREGWGAGQPEPVEDLLGRWPTDAGRDPDAASLIVEDFLQRRRRGDEPSVVEYRDRFPGHAESINAAFSRQAIYSALGDGSVPQAQILRLPDVNDEVFGFRLRHPLGRGAFARVFLAEQADLAGRPVVLKVSAIEGTEPQTLAQLQHTHIVPIYSVHEDPRAGVRAVCMPYFGGASLSEVLRELWATCRPPTTGRQFVAALEAVRSPSHKELGGDARGTPVSAAAAPAGDRSPLARLEGASYAQAAALVVAQLADGLSHAHQRGILHRDIKPSNVLIGSDGGPLLLDFNLAHETNNSAAHATLGGTVSFMAPEHLRALTGRTASLIAKVDARSDIYSLGLVLAEMLSGHNPFDQSASYSVLPLQIEAMALERSAATPSVRGGRPDVPWDMESIVRKCLAPEPDDRYQSADHLAEDLRRFLDDRPLRFAPALSRADQVRKYLRRHPRLTSSGSVAAAALVLILGVVSALVGVRRHLDEARAKDRLAAHAAGVTRALCLVNTTEDLGDHLRQGAAVCEETLRVFEPPGGGPLETHPDWPRLTAPQRAKLAEDRRELLMLLAGARVRLSGGGGAALRGALALLDRAEAVGGLAPSRALWVDRASYLERLGQTDRAREARDRAGRTPAATARDHYFLAAAYSRQGGPEKIALAVAELDKALDLNPRDYWATFQRGLCRLELGQPVLAAGDFGACTGLWPEFAWGYFNRGCVLERAGRKAEAADDYTAALRRDPAFALAYVNRGKVRLELRQYAPALADYDEALALGNAGAVVHAGRGMALESLGRHAEADAAFRRAEALAATDPPAVRTRIDWTYAFAVSGRLPGEAKRAFGRVLAAEPANPQAHYGLAMMAATRGETDEAIGHLGRAASADPNFMPARRYRAVLLARRRLWDQAGREINGCLEREPGSGATLYAAACVAALAAEATGDRAAGGQALDLLTKAAACGPLPASAADDPDLASLRPLPGFRRLTAPGGTAGAGAKPERPAADES